MIKSCIFPTLFFQATMVVDVFMSSTTESFGSILANGTLGEEGGFFGGNRSLGDEEESLCSNLSNDFLSGQCRFWIQGILLAVVGSVGIIGNSVS